MGERRTGVERERGVCICDGGAVSVKHGKLGISVTRCHAIPVTSSGSNLGAWIVVRVASE